VTILPLSQDYRRQECPFVPKRAINSQALSLPFAKPKLFFESL